MIFNLVWLPARQTGSSTRTKVLLRIMLRDTTACEDDLVKQALRACLTMEYFERLGHRHAGPGGNWRVRRRLRHFLHVVRGSGSGGGSGSSSCRRWPRCASAAVMGQSAQTSSHVWKPGTRPCAGRKPLRLWDQCRSSSIPSFLRMRGLHSDA